MNTFTILFIGQHIELRSRAARDSASFPRSQFIQFRSFVHLMLSRVDDRRAAERRLFRKIFPCEDDAVPVTLV